MALHITKPGGEHTARPVVLTTKGQISVALIRLERALEHLTEAELVDLVVELRPIMRVVRMRAQVQQLPRVDTPLGGRLAV